MQIVYLDNAATTPIAPEVRAAMRPYLEEEFGNPSSRHPLGVRAAEAVERARTQLARALLVPARNVVFTSGGTEAANLALTGIARASRASGRHVLVGATEHACVRESAASLAREGFEVESLAPEASLDPARFAARLRPDTTLVAQMYVQNEFGTIHPIAALAKLVRARAPRAKLVVDAVQAFGKLECALPELGAHALILSAHKIHGPKGAGAVAFAGEVALEPLLHGGGQERSLRPGTENVPAIVGFGAAAELAEARRDEVLARTKRLRARLCERMAALSSSRVIAPGPEVLPGIVCVSIPGAPAEVRMHHLERRGVYVSTGSACQAARGELSPALRALGLSDDENRRVLRISMSALTTEAEVDAAADALVEVSRELEGAQR